MCDEHWLCVNKVGCASSRPMYVPRQFVERVEDVDQSSATHRRDPINHDDSVSLYATMSRGSPSVVSDSRSFRGHADGGDAKLKRAVSAPMSSRPGRCGSIINEASDSDDEHTGDYVLFNPAASPSPRQPAPPAAAAAGSRDSSDPRALSRHSTSVVHTRPSAEQLKASHCQLAIYFLNTYFTVV